MIAMPFLTGQINRFVVFFLYALYALTPVHQYAMTGAGNGSPDCLGAGKHTTTDIVWANTLFSSLVDDGAAAGGAQQDDDVVLVKKRRAVLREHVPIHPLVETGDLPPAVFGTGSRSLRRYELLNHPVPRDTSGYPALNTGLSPPNSFS